MGVQECNIKGDSNMFNSLDPEIFEKDLPNHTRCDNCGRQIKDFDIELKETLLECPICKQLLCFDCWEDSVRPDPPNFDICSTCDYERTTNGADS